MPNIPNSSRSRQVRFNVQRSNYYHSYSDLQDPSIAFSWPFSFVQDAPEQKSPSWLEWLRRFAEISKLAAGMAQNRLLQSAINPLKAPVNKVMIHDPKFKYEDFLVVGYTAFICQKCLISHPLTLYRHIPSMKIICTNHECDTETVVDAQRQIMNKKGIIATISNEMPKLMFQVVKRWTKGTPLVVADEIQFSPEVLNGCILVDGKNWAHRAVQNVFTLLSDEDLADFLNTARGNTYGIFNTAKSNKSYYMRIVVPGAPKAHIDNNFRFGN